MRSDRFEDSLAAGVLHAGGLAEVRLGTGVRCVLLAPSFVLEHPIVLTMELWAGGGLVELRVVDGHAAYAAVSSSRGRPLTAAERQSAPAAAGVRSVRVVELPESTARWAHEEDIVARARSLPAQERSNSRDGVWVSVEAWQDGQRVGVEGITHELDADTWPEHATLVHALFSACRGLAESDEERAAVALSLR